MQPINIVKTKLHNNGMVYKKFNLRGDKDGFIGYLRIVGIEYGTDEEYCLYEILHVYKVEVTRFDSDRIIRVIEEKVNITSVPYATFKQLLPAMLIVDEFSTIELITTEQEIYKVGNYIEG